MTTQKLTHQELYNAIKVMARDELWLLQQRMDFLNRINPKLEKPFTEEELHEASDRILAYQRKYILLKADGAIGVGLIFDVPELSEYAAIEECWRVNHATLVKLGIIAPVAA